MPKGLFITIDGIDGTGKSTQVELLKRRFRRLKYKFMIVREPGATKVSEQIRSILLNPKNRISPETETMLYIACRLQLLSEKIIPLLSKGYIVVSDRYLASTICYQGAGLGLGTNRIVKLWDIISNHREPDLNLILHAPVSTALSRTTRNDRISRRNSEYFTKVARCFSYLPKQNNEKYKLIDATLDKKSVSDKIWAYIEKIL